MRKFLWFSSTILPNFPFSNNLLLEVTNFILMGCLDLLDESCLFAHFFVHRHLGGNNLLSHPIQLCRSTFTQCGFIYETFTNFIDFRSKALAKVLMSLVVHIVLAVQSRDLIFKMSMHSNSCLTFVGHTGLQTINAFLQMKAVLLTHLFFGCVGILHC